MRKVVRVTVGTDLLESLKQVLVTLVCCGLALGAVEFLATQRAITKCNAGLELITIEQKIRSITNTARIIVALVVVGKGTPLGSLVDAALGENNATRLADEVASRRVLDEVRWILLALRAHHTDAQVLLPFLRSLWLRLGVREGSWGQEV